jgi:hypothetical protein
MSDEPSQLKTFLDNENILAEATKLAYVHALRRYNDRYGSVVYINGSEKLLPQETIKMLILSYPNKQHILNITRTVIKLRNFLNLPVDIIQTIYCELNN